LLHPREGALETLTHLNRLTGAGVYRSFTEPYFDSCGIFTDAVISILGTIANLERIRLSERVQSLASARSRGKRLGRPKKNRGCLKNCSFSLTGLWFAKTPSGFKINKIR